MKRILLNNLEWNLSTSGCGKHPGMGRGRWKISRICAIFSSPDFLSPVNKKCAQSVTARKVWGEREGLARGVPSSRWRELRPTFWPKVIYAACCVVQRGKGEGYRLTSDTENENKSVGLRDSIFKKCLNARHSWFSRKGESLIEIGVCTYKVKHCSP